MRMTATDRPRTWNLLIYGRTGTGKSSLGVTAPDPLILLGETQGFESVRDAAVRLGKPTPPTFHVKHADELRSILLRLMEDDETPIRSIDRYYDPESEYAPPYERPRTIVLDSITEFMELLCDEIDEQSPPRIAKDGLPERSRRFWGELSKRSGRLLRTLRDLPYNVVLLARLMDKEIGEGNAKARIVAPALPMNKMPEEVAAVTNGVGLAFKLAKPKAKSDTEFTYNVRFAGPDHFMLKALRPLKDIEPADLSDWFERLDTAHA